jgi:hypothetical protein
MEKEQFIENIFNSTNGIVKDFPNEVILDRIQTQIENEKPAENYIKWFVAASIFLLISLNIGILNNSNKNKNNDLSTIVIIADNQIY